MRRDKVPQRRTHHTAAAATTTWNLSSLSNLFWNKTLWMVVSWKWHSAPMMNLGRSRAGKSWKRLNFWKTTGQMSSAEAYAVTEFKNASSDMKNATRTFMETKDLVSRVKHARGYFPVVGVVLSMGFQTITPRRSRQTGAGKGASTGMNSQTGKGRGRGFGKGNHLEILDVHCQPNPV